MSELIRCKAGKNFYDLTFRVSASKLKKLLSKDGKVKLSAKKISVKKEVDIEPEILAVNLSRAYQKAKKVYHRNKNIALITPDLPGFESFRKAVNNIIIPHKVNNFKRFMQCQVSGLSFVDNGKGKFPTPNQLFGHGAEDRYLEHYNKKTKKEVKADFLDSRVRLTEEEKNTPLSGNTKYQHSMILVKDGLSSDLETIYVAKLQEVRRQKVEPFVKKRLKDLGIKWKN